jgi:hypothetical protein
MLLTLGYYALGITKNSFTASHTCENEYYHLL